MGFLSGLRAFNRITDKMERSHDEFHRLTDKSQRTEDDIKCIRRAKLWSWLNILLSVVAGGAVYLSISMIISFSAISLGGVFLIMLSGWAYGTSLRKAYTYTDDNAPSLGAVILSKLAFVIAGIMIALGLILIFLIGPISL